MRRIAELPIDNAASAIASTGAPSTARMVRTAYSEPVATFFKTHKYRLADPGLRGSRTMR